MGSPLSKITRQYYFKIMMHALHKSNKATLKKDKTKHISPKFFYTHELQKIGEM